MDSRSSTPTVIHRKTLLQAAQQLDWLREPCAAIYESAELSAMPDVNCCLRWLVAHPVRRRLKRSAINHLESLIQQGYCLSGTWRCWQASIDRWVGQRLLLAHASLFSKQRRLLAVGCSRIGRHGVKLPRWPELVEAALRYCATEGYDVAVCRGTTLSDQIASLAASAGLAAHQICQAAEHDPVDWLTQALTAQRVRFPTAASALLVSPAFQPAAEQLDRFPLRDRLIFALSDAVHILYAKPNSNTWQLAKHRLTDRYFPTGSLFAAIVNDQASLTRSNLELLSGGAVGWYVDVATDPLAMQKCPSRCRTQQEVNHPTVHHAIAPVSCLYHGQNARTWEFLSHCTRAASGGKRPLESEASYLHRTWMEGYCESEDPFSVLCRILNDRKLIGSTALVRSDVPCVSFSAVPLRELLCRRRYMSHLGRWDWEPYGIMVQREVLESLGAKPVIYKPRHVIDDMPIAQRRYAQPVPDSDNDGRYDWSIEREWRLMGDLRLDDLPANAARLFVGSRIHAYALARMSGYPVYWNDLRQ